MMSEIKNSISMKATHNMTNINVFAIVRDIVLITSDQFLYILILVSKTIQNILKITLLGTYESQLITLYFFRS